MAVARPIDTEDSRVNDDHAHGALPKLYGAPAYARPPAAPVNPVERPLDLDDLPLEAERSAEDEDLLSAVSSGVQGRAYESAVMTESDPSSATVPAGGSARLRGRPFRLRLPGRR